MGDPCSIFGECGPYSAGGWVQMGYFNKANTLFNSYQDNFQLQQAWLWAEKSLDTSGGFDFGGRVDYMYGTDSQDTQAFGTDPRGWDNGWDNGANYGFAMPQLYGEVGYGDLSVKVGHFYTIIGYEVVTGDRQLPLQPRLHDVQQRAVYAHRCLGDLQPVRAT